MSCPQHPWLETSAAVSCALVRAAITSVVLTNCRSSKIRVHRKAAAGDLGRGSGEHQGDPEGTRVRGLRGDRGIRRQASAKHYATTLRACAGERTSRSRTPPPRNGVRRPCARRSRAVPVRREPVASRLPRGHSACRRTARAATVWRAAFWACVLFEVTPSP